MIIIHIPSCLIFSSKISHKSSKCTHEENRKKVCAPCGKKIVIHRKSSFLINEDLEKLLKKFLLPDFHHTNEKYPLAICGSCRLTLQEYDKKIYKRQLPGMPNYTDIILRPNTRFLKTYECYICLTARSPAHFKTQKGRGHFRDIVNKADTSKSYKYPKVETSSLEVITPEKSCAPMREMFAADWTGDTT